LANPKMTKQWFEYAARNLEVAKMMVGHGTEFKNEIAFHVQQCIEKCTKGYLVFHEVRVSKTHKIEDLAKFIAPIDPALLPLFRGAKRISNYAVAYGSPDSEVKPISFTKAKVEVKLAEKIFNRLLKEVT